MLGAFNKKIIYVHGRPGPHPQHRALAMSVASEERFVDSFIRWQDKNYPVFINICIWFLNAIFYKDPRKHDIFLVDNLHFTFAFMKSLGLLSKKQKIIVHLGSHTLYFMYSGKFSKLNLMLHKYALKKYDYVICEGPMSLKLCESLAGKSANIYESCLGLSNKKINMLLQINPQLNGNQILIVASGPEKFRMHYKGLDLMFEAYDIAFKRSPFLQLCIIGEWDETTKSFLLAKLSAEARSTIKFTGYLNNLSDYLNMFTISALCLHCARGDAFPTSTIESMTAGLPVLVSEWTGTHNIVSAIDPNLVARLEAKEIAAKINAYFQLSQEEKKTRSENCRKQVSHYTEENAIRKYKEIFEKITSH